jgi:hypothetical protein
VGFSIFHFPFAALASFSPDLPAAARFHGLLPHEHRQRFFTSLGGKRITNYWGGNMGRFALLAAIVVVMFGKTSLCQITNWSELLHEMASRDPIVVKGAEQKLDLVLPKLQTMDVQALEKEVVSILEGLRDSDEAVRFKAAAMLATLAMIRQDATGVLKPAVPLLIPQLSSEFKYGLKRLKDIALLVIVNIRPEIPAEALEPLLDSTRGQDRKMAAVATFGVGRFAKTSPKAVDEFVHLLGPEQPIEIRSYGVRSLEAAAFEGAALVHPLILMRLGEILEGKGLKAQESADDRELVRQTLDVVARLGPAAVSLRPQVERIALENQLFSQEARSALLRLKK